MSDHLVSIVMITCNHEEFISRAIESVLEQKTTFEYKLIIGEDYSTDRTREICIQYSLKNEKCIELLAPRGKKLGAIQNYYRTITAAKSKYIAICEGDDYWTDPYKLQNQVDFLEKNPEYGLVHGDVNHLFQESGKLIKAFNKTRSIRIPSGDILEQMFKPRHMIKTMTVCFRRDIFVKHYLNDPEIMRQDWRMIDLSIWFVFAKHSKIHYCDEIFSTYRLLRESMSRSKDSVKLFKFHKKIHDIREYFANRYNASHEIKQMLKIRRFKSDIYDAINMRDNTLKIASIKKYKEAGGKLSFREKVSICFSNCKIFLK